MPVTTWVFREEGSANVIRAHDRVAAARKRAAAVNDNARRSGGGARKSPEEKQAADAIKATERAEREKQRLAERSARTAEQLRIRSYRSESRSLERHHNEQLRIAERGAKALVATEAKAVKERAAKRDRLTQRMGGIAGGAIIGAGALGIAAFAGAGAVVGGAARSRAETRKLASALSKQSRQSGQIAIDPEELMAEATKTAKRVRGGVKADEILRGQQTYVGLTGDIDSAREHSKMFAQLSVASGADMSDIASTAASLKTSFGIGNAEMGDVMGKLYSQGKAGSFELKDFAQYGQALAASGRRFGLSGAEGAGTLGGLANIARMTTGDGATASTATQAMLRQLIAKGGAGKESIKALTGADVFTDKSHTKTRKVEDILVDVIGGAGGDQTKLQSIFQDEGIRGVSALISAYNEASNAMDKGASAAEKRAAGENAVREMLKQTVGVTGGLNEVLVDYTASTKEGSATWDSAMEDISSAVGDALLPSFAKLAENMPAVITILKPFADAIGGAIDALAGMAEWGIKHGFLKAPEKEKEHAAPVSQLLDNQTKQRALKEKEKQLGGLSPTDQAEMRKLKGQEIALKEQATTATRGGRITAANVAGSMLGPLAPIASVGVSGLDDAFWDPEKMATWKDEEKTRGNAAQGASTGDGESPEEIGARLKRNGQDTGAVSLMGVKNGNKELFRDPLEVIGLRGGAGKTLGGGDGARIDNAALIATLQANTAATERNTAASRGGGGVQPGAPVVTPTLGR